MLYQSKPLAVFQIKCHVDLAALSGDWNVNTFLGFTFDQFVVFKTVYSLMLTCW